MGEAKHGECQSIINQICNYIKAKIDLPNLDLIIAFAQRYLFSSSLEDLKLHSINTLVQIVLSHWHFSYQRAVNETKVRIFNPDQMEKGWPSVHTVIQISHDDIPFLVDSTRMVINKYGYQIHFIIHFGGLKVRRNEENQIIELLSPNTVGKGVTTEAPIFIEIDRIVDPLKMAALKTEIENVLADVRAAVADWHEMLGRVESCLTELERNPPSLDLAEVAESCDFLRWLINNNFTFLGSRDYKLIGDSTNRALQLIPGSGLGVLRDESSAMTSKSYAKLPPQARKMALSKDVLIIAKTNTDSTVHRKVKTDYIGVKRFNEEGELIGERRFIGLYTSTAYHSSPRQIPFLRHKVDKVINDLGYPPDSHDGKEVVHILETLPRDDLFQATHEELLYLTLSILQLKERKRVRLLVRRDAFYRYFSCLVYVPREVFNTDLTLDIQTILMDSFHGVESTFTTYFSDSVLARLHYLIRVNPKNGSEFDIDQIEKKIIAVSHSWTDELKNQLINRFEEAQGLNYFYKYKKAFPAGYMEYCSAHEAIDDIEKIENLSVQHTIAMLFKMSQQGILRLKLFHAEHSIILSDVLPILENMGLRIISERTYEVKLPAVKANGSNNEQNGMHIWVHDFDMTYVNNKEIVIEEVKENFLQAFKKIWFAEVENDGFNRLILEAQLDWQEVVMLRAYTKYLRQIGFNFSQNYIEQTLINNPVITRHLVQLFVLRFDPAQLRNATYMTKEASLFSLIEQSLENVASLDEDRILRKLLEIILATIRTNYFQQSQEGVVKSYLSFKFNPSAIIDLPLPKPKFEIFVYSPRVEGVHLRAGKVARGGLRWSDRREDFRTEILGLMKAQQVKNTVIVPEGAKGGFTIKSSLVAAMSREDLQKEAIACYTIFISGLLDLTDNIKEGVVIPPTRVVRYDEDDPYLVVAADKGTATFSDIANNIAQQYGFWLDDAFASGGSQGYDHKKMGITSRGVWVSVKRHFRELNIDPDQQEFTVVGIGDMSGDVFGNGMLLSKHIKLLAAFNHEHIFLDPNPDAASSYEERKRLFQLPRSTWLDYNPALISQGGGIFNRSAKTIKLSPEMKVALNIQPNNLVPNELIKAILRAPVDLVWNGGIGTFVKATQETHADVGDRTNDNIRIDAIELQARVVAEGGNLGLTQLARIEYSLNGGIVNTDFIDNSAGVDCSDHEVNIKILLNQFLSSGEMTREQRNKLLEKMTHEIANLVLLDNYEQTEMLSLEASVAHHTMDLFRQYMNDLEKTGRLNRKLEYLPDDKTVLERKTNNKPLTRPEIAMLLSYSKMYLKQEILQTELPEDHFFDKYLLTAFPQTLCNLYDEAIKQHSLRREIIATQLCKAITDRMGINFIERLERETGAAPSFIIRSFVIAESIFKMSNIWHQITALDYQVEATVQYRMMLQVYYLIRRATRWFLRNRKPDIAIQPTIDHFASGVTALIQQLPQLLDPIGQEAFDSAIQYYVDSGVPNSLAQAIACCNTLFTALDIVEASHKYNLDLTAVAKAYYLLGSTLELNWLREIMNSYNVENQWSELARAGFRDDLDRVQRKLSVKVLSKKSSDKTIETKIDKWMGRNHFLIERWQKLLADVKASDMVDFVTYSVVLRELFDFAQAT